MPNLLPSIRRIVEREGVWLCKDINMDGPLQNDLIVLISDGQGGLWSIKKDVQLDPALFKRDLITNGPFR